MKNTRTIRYPLSRRGCEWGRGLATEAARAVIGWAEALAYTRLWEMDRNWNAPSRRVMIKLGFAQTSRIEPDAGHGDSLFYVKDLRPDHRRGASHAASAYGGGSSPLA